MQKVEMDVKQKVEEELQHYDSQRDNKRRKRATIADMEELQKKIEDREKLLIKLKEEVEREKALTIETARLLDQEKKDKEEAQAKLLSMEDRMAQEKKIGILKYGFFPLFPFFRFSLFPFSLLAFFFLFLSFLLGNFSLVLA